LREFKFDLSRGYKLNEEILPPPSMTYHTLPFNWGWHQNPNIAEEVDPVTGKLILTNNSKLVKFKMEYLNHYMESVPQAPSDKIPDDPQLHELINELKIAFNERPIWTKRAVVNRVSHSPRLYLMRQALPFVGYRFKGGPFRDAIIKYGLDPRKDPKYRMYQTIYFVLYEGEKRPQGTPWQDPRTSMNISKKTRKKMDASGHFFDGKTLILDGRLWQMCDVTDPLLAKLIRDAPVRPEFEPDNEGWFFNGTIAKIKAIMRAKLLAIRAGMKLNDEDFTAALEVPDFVPNRLAKQISVPVPNVKLSTAAMQRVKESGGDLSTINRRQKMRSYLGPMRTRQPPIDSKATNGESEQEKHRSTGMKQKSKSKSPDECVDEFGRKQVTAIPLDPRLHADQGEDDDPGFGIGDDGGIDDQAGGYERYDGGMDAEMEDSERDEDDTDRSDESEDEDSDMDEPEGSGDEDDNDHERDDSDSADSVDFVRYFDPQLAQYDEG
jgi:general transcription factor 3C polypeptide 5 (transcription factor C subunit 1)